MGKNKAVTSVQPRLASRAESLSGAPRVGLTHGEDTHIHTAMAENAGLENHRFKSFKNKGRDAEVSRRPGCCELISGSRASDWR